MLHIILIYKEAAVQHMLYIKLILKICIHCSLSVVGLLCGTCVLSCFSRVLTFCDPMDCSPPGSFVYGILQARTLEWVAMLSSKGSS